MNERYTDIQRSLKRNRSREKEMKKNNKSQQVSLKINKDTQVIYVKKKSCIKNSQNKNKNIITKMYCRFERKERLLKIQREKELNFSNRTFFGLERE